MSSADLRAIQKRIREGIDAYLRGDGWEIPRGAVVYQRVSPSGSDAGFRVALSGKEENEADTLIGVVVDLILQTGRRLRRCPECGKVFVAVRRQEYCSTAHAQKVRNQRKK